MKGWADPTAVGILQFFSYRLVQSSFLEHRKIKLTIIYADRHIHQFERNQLNFTCWEQHTYKQFSSAEDKGNITYTGNRGDE